MKGYERRRDERAMPQLPIAIRLDGRAFSMFTQGLQRPYDSRLSGLMIDLTVRLVKETSANVGYTQSDEITLILVPKTWEETGEPNGSQMYFDARLSKIVSVLASLAGAFFARHLPERIPEKADALPVFDARAFEVPTIAEAANVVLWRELDATKNALQMVGHDLFSVNELNGKSTQWIREQLPAHGIDWDAFPDGFKRGTFVRRRTVEKSPGVFRPLIVGEPLPPLITLANLPEVLFRCGAPVLRSEASSEGGSS